MSKNKKDMGDWGWEKRHPHITRSLELTSKTKDGNIFKSNIEIARETHYPDGMVDVEGSQEAIVHLTENVREIYITPYKTEHYSLVLRRECPEGTLGIFEDRLDIGIRDEKEVEYIKRVVSDSSGVHHGEKCYQKYLFENGKFVSFARSSFDICKEIPEDRSFVTDDTLNRHYDSFKRLRPDVSQSLENCLAGLRN